MLITLLAYDERIVYCINLAKNKQYCFLGWLITHLTYVNIIVRMFCLSAGSSVCQFQSYQPVCQVSVLAIGMSVCQSISLSIFCQSSIHDLILSHTGVVPHPLIMAHQRHVCGKPILPPKSHIRKYISLTHNSLKHSFANT